MEKTFQLSLIFILFLTYSSLVMGYGKARSIKIWPEDLQNVHSEVFQQIMNDWSCHTCNNNHGMKRQITLPGTKWCGPGNAASSYSDLGSNTGEDKCCREHDHCKTFLKPFECIANICNNSIFTKSHCDCDTKFKKCLTDVQSNLSAAINGLYSLFAPKCFDTPERTRKTKWHTKMVPYQAPELGQFGL